MATLPNSRGIMGLSDQGQTVSSPPVYLLVQDDEDLKLRQDWDLEK